jgi:hypothetical protein
MDFKLNQVAPGLRPLIEKRPVGRFHQLVARRQVLIDPTRDVRKAVRRHATVFLEPTIYGCGFTVAEMLNYHEQRHAGSPAALLVIAATIEIPLPNWDLGTV